VTDPWPGMKIVSRSDERVMTTGADWHFDGEDAEASQRIGVERPLLRLCGIGSCYTDVRADSVLVLRARRATEIRVEILFEPVYRARHRGRWMTADEQGGVGVYPLRSRLVTRTSSLRLDAGDEAWIAAFPPRERSAHREAQRIAHEGRPTPYPDGVYPGPVDTEMAEPFKMDKASPADVARTILEAVENGDEDVYPDQMAAEIHAGLLGDPKATEKKIGEMLPE